MFNGSLGRLSQLTTHVPKTLTTFNGSLTRQISFMKEVELLILLFWNRHMPVFQKNTYVSDVSRKYMSVRYP